MLRGQTTRLLVATVGAAAILLVAVLAFAMSRDIGNDALGRANTSLDTASDFTLPTFEGQTFVLSEHASGPVFVYFWASWCAPCEAEAPMIQSLWPEYEALGYTFVGINIWNVEAEARAFIERHDITFPTVIDDGETYLDYGVYAVPEAFFLLPGLEVNAKYIGELSEDAFRERLAEIEPPS
ncbi:MAG: TlpA family protein disulfide reductase [Dehalococcoidia bacterium]|jgi:peroxiredoxin|nr:TlpA family protein disulfide reductase [Dehalococcoidia bacterium]